MKKLLFAALLAGVFGFQAVAQESMIEKDDKIVNIGIGLGSIYYIGSYYKTAIPPLSISFEKAIIDGIAEKGVIGVGGYAGISSYKWEYPYTYFGTTWGYKYTNFIIGARGSFHYPLVEKLDTYTGLTIGFNIASTKEYGTVDPNYVNRDSHGGLVYAWYAGGRYYFSEKFAAMAEIGYGITYLNLGLAFKL